MPVKKATLTHLKSLAVLFDKYRMFYHQKSDVGQAELFLSSRIKNNESEIFISFDNEDTVTGFVQLYPLFSPVRIRKLWLLNDLFVDKGHRGQGFSLALIDRAKELCRATNACGLILETGKDNVIGNNLYPRTGFELNTDHNFYSWDVE